MPAFGVVGVLTLAGVMGAVRTSLRRGLLSGQGTGLDAWRRVLADPGFLRSLSFTARVTALSLALALPMAIGLALALRRSRWAPAALGLPVAAPHLVVATLVVLWLGPGGLVDRVVGGLPVSLVGDRAGLGIVAVYVVKEAPFLAVMALAALDEATAELEATAALLGAGRWARWRDVILPRLARPLAAGSAVAAAFVVGGVEVPLAVGPTRPALLGPYALDVVRLAGPAGRADAAAAELLAAILVGLVLLVIGLPVAIASRRWTRR